MDFERFNKLRIEKGMTATAICKKLGVSSAYFTDSKKKNIVIPESRVKVIANILDTTPEYLNGETDNPYKTSPEEKEVQDLLEELQNRDEMKMLFSVAKGATTDEILQAVKIIEALRK